MQQNQPSAAGKPLDEKWRRKLRGIVSRSNERVACAALDIPRQTLARALAGLGLRSATREILIMRLAVLLDEPLFAPRDDDDGEVA